MIFVKDNKENQNEKRNKNINWFELIVFSICCLSALICGIRLLQDKIFGLEISNIDVSIFSAFAFSFLVLVVYEYIVKDD